MTEKITINGVTYSRTVPSNVLMSCKGCVAHDPNAEEDTELCQALTAEYGCRFTDDLWEVAKPEPKRVECWAYIGTFGVMTDSKWHCEDDVWRIALGWPDKQDIESAKQRGDRVCRVIVEIPDV